MSQFNAYFSTLTITYLLEAYALRKINVVNEDELILNITSMVSVMGTKDNIAIPSQNKQLYAEMLNKNSGTMMIVLDELVNATYIIRFTNKANVYNDYMINFEHEYIKKFIASHGVALKYVSHHSYSLKRNISQVYNEENSLCEAIENMKLSSKAPETPINSKTMSNNSAPERKKKKCEDGFEENADLVAKLDKAFEQVEEDNKEYFEHTNVQEEVYYVKSESNPKLKYMVTSTSCTCPAFTYGKGKSCKHMNTALNNFVKNQKEDKNLDNSLLIKAIYSVQRDSDLDNFYNIYLHVNDKYSCTCPSYKYGQDKDCKHITKFVNNHYQKYDKFTLVNHFKKIDNTPMILNNQMLYLYTNKNFSQKMFNDETDTLYFISQTKYYGLYVWAFDDSITDSKLEKDDEASDDEASDDETSDDEASDDDKSV